MVVKNEGNPIVYDSDSYAYSDIFEFLNVHSQIFVDPNAADNAPKQSAAAKPWLVVPVPEMTATSGNDICFKKDGALCVIMLTNERPANQQDATLDLLDKVGQSFTSKISRGVQFIFSWLDVTKEPEFAAIFGVEEYPKLVILNPGKRKRFMLHEGEIKSSDIEATFEKILGGDARFKNIKGNALPDLVSEYGDGEEGAEAKKEDL